MYNTIIPQGQLALQCNLLPEDLNITLLTKCTLHFTYRTDIMHNADLYRCPGIIEIRFQNMKVAFFHDPQGKVVRDLEFHRF